jgi:hypothetical protein
MVNQARATASRSKCDVPEKRFSAAVVETAASSVSRSRTWQWRQRRETSRHAAGGRTRERSRCRSKPESLTRPLRSRRACRAAQHFLFRIEPVVELAVLRMPFAFPDRIGAVEYFFSRGAFGGIHSREGLSGRRRFRWPAGIHEWRRDLCRVRFHPTMSDHTQCIATCVGGKVRARCAAKRMRDVNSAWNGKPPVLRRDRRRPGGARDSRHSLRGECRDFALQLGTHFNQQRLS